MGDVSPIRIGCFAAINTTNAVSITAVDGNAAGRLGASEISVRPEISGPGKIDPESRISGNDKIFGEEQKSMAKSLGRRIFFVLN
jgi:hypothetical protein